MKRFFTHPFAMLAGLLAAAGIIVLALTASTTAPTTSGKLQIVAGENFWGSLASQIGGSRAQVLDVVSDPNADPHEYESSATTARAVATADYVILNGAGYDSWGDKLLSAGGSSGRKVLTVASLLGKKDGDNPHFWYNPAYVNRVAARIESDLSALEPHDSSYFEANYRHLQAGLAGYQQLIADIRQQFAGTQVAATEDIAVYLADAAGLDLVSPPAFTEAVAEGNDPPASSVAAFQQQLENGQIKLLIYNQQTATPLTDSMKRLAASRGIPAVGITETIQPPQTTFEDWMSAQLTRIQNALTASAKAR